MALSDRAPASEPVHLLPLPRATSGQACERCGDDFLHLTRFGGKFACHPCIQACMCKDCRTEWAADGADACEACDVKFYCANPAEFDDALPVLRLSDWGRRMIHLVLVRRVSDAMAAQDYETASAALQQVIEQRRVAA